jgi:hypothetical protein
MTISMSKYCIGLSNVLSLHPNSTIVNSVLQRPDLFKIQKQGVSLLPCPWAQHLSRDGLRDAGFLCNKAAVFKEMVKTLSCMIWRILQCSILVRINRSLVKKRDLYIEMKKLSLSFYSIWLFLYLSKRFDFFLHCLNEKKKERPKINS